MVIGIDINQVLRDFLSQLEYTYNKYKIGEEIKIEDTPVTSFNLIDHFPFTSIDAMNKFLYQDAALEVFGHADQLHDNIMNMLNVFAIDFEDEGEHELCIISREAMLSIPATLFFLSKTACKIGNIRFSVKYEDMWDGIDVMITANPKLIELKPENKTVIKVNTTYNTETKAEYEIDTLFDFMKNKELRDNILNK